VQAAERLEVTWSEPTPPFPEMAALYDHIRQAPVIKRETPVATGAIEAAFAASASSKQTDASYSAAFRRASASIGRGHWRIIFFYANIGFERSGQAAKLCTGDVTEM